MSLERHLVRYFSRLLATSLAMVLSIATAVTAQQSLHASATAPGPTARVARAGSMDASLPPEVIPPPAAGGTPIAPADPPRDSLSLDQVCELALSANPALVRARAQIDSRIGVAVQKGIPPNPRFDSGNPQVFAGHQSQYNAGFMQEIPVKSKLQLDRAAAEREVGQARYAYIRQRFELLTRVRQQFYRVLAQQRRVEVLAELAEIAARSHAAAEQRARAGGIAESDVILLYTDLLQARIALTNARTQLDGARRALAATIGIPDLLVDVVVGEWVNGLPTFDEEAARQFVATRNAGVLEAELLISQNRLLLRRARVEPYPNPDFGPAIAMGPTSNSSGGWGSQLWLNLYIDIPVWNLNQGNIYSADANVREAAAAVDVLRNDLLRRTAESLADYRAARERGQYIGEFILPAAERGQRLVLSAYGVGARDVSTVLQAQRALIQARLDYVDALENAWISAAEMAGLLQVERFP